MFHAIIQVFTESDDKDFGTPIQLRYRQAYDKVVKLVDRSVSYRDFQVHINQMVNENILYKDDPMQGKRGSKVNLSLTDKARKKYRLKILGIDERTQKYRSLYQLLICFDEFKKHEMLTEIQLDGFLGKMGCSRNDLREHRISNAGIFFKPIKGVQIVKWTENDSKVNIRAGFYSVSIPGFTTKEFILSLKKLKKGKDPRLLSSYPVVTDIPFVLYIDYKEEEVKDAIDLLRTDRVIKVINDVFPDDEVRYDIADESLKDFIKCVWLVHDYDFRLLIERLVYNGKPVSEDKDYLTSFLGKKYADRILANAYHIRDSYKKENNGEEQRRIARRFIEGFDNGRKSLIQEIVKKYGKVIKEYNILSEIIQEICFPHFISKP